MSHIEGAPDLAEVDEALDRLSEGQRAMLRLSYFHGISHRDIARQAEIPLTEVKSVLAAGLRNLAELLQSSDLGRAVA